jgi:hypothetical protein
MNFHSHFSSLSLTNKVPLLDRLRKTLNLLKNQKQLTQREQLLESYQEKIYYLKKAPKTIKRITKFRIIINSRLELEALEDLLQVHQ